MRILSVPDINRIRRRHHDSVEHSMTGMLGLGCALFMSLMLVISSVSVTLLYLNLTRDLPSVELIPSLLDPPRGILLQPTTFYDRTGKYEIFKLENPAVEERRFLDLDETQPNYLPKHLVSATIAVVEPDYWESQGFSLSTFDLSMKDTITQRLVADLLFWQEKAGLRRDLRERFLSAQLKTQFGPEKVLTWYLNNANYGRLAYGAEAAAQVYFGKSAAELNLAEAAVLTAVAEAPSLNPIDAPEAARERGNEVIHTMLGQGLISTEQAEAAFETDLQFQSPVESPDKLAPAFVRLVVDSLGEQFDLQHIERGGLQVITTLDYDIQSQATCASQTLLNRLEDPSAQVQAIQDECQAARLLPSILNGSNIPLRELGANVVVLDPDTGEILAMIGEYGTELNPAQRPGHPTGSVLTPIVYLAGFTQGLGPASLVWDLPLNTADKQASDNQFMGPVRLRVALANDYLMPIQQVLTQVGTDKVLRLAKQLGLSNATIPLDSDSTTLLEKSKATLLELSRAFGVFASQGILVGTDFGKTNDSNRNSPIYPLTVLNITDLHGKSWFDGNTILRQPVISPQLAYLMTDVLSDETARWQSMGHPNPLEIGRPVAAKMGSTKEKKDAWTIGYTPELVIGIWIGHKNSQSSGQVPAIAAAALWHAIMQYAVQDLPPEGWQEVAGTNSLSVCDPSGLLPTKDCPKVVNEIFLAGYEPTQMDTLYKRLQINRETGLLATAFTPPELIEERVYLVVPPEASEWARQAGLPTPPESYDVINNKINISPNAEISSPGMFDYVRGVVPVIGTATGDDFNFYRLQVGEGLNPRHWIQLGNDVFEQVSNEELGVWDASKLNGLYVLQLLVIDKDQHVETNTIHVTVDNEPPEVEIIYPSDGQEIENSEESITIQVEVIDNLAVDKVDFYINNQPTHSLGQPPYSVPVQIKPGIQTLRVLVTDKAGNQKFTEVDFLVKE